MNPWAFLVSLQKALVTGLCSVPLCESLQCRAALREHEISGHTLGPVLTSPQRRRKLRKGRPDRTEKCGRGCKGMGRAAFLFLR